MTPTNIEETKKPKAKTTVTKMPSLKNPLGVSHSNTDRKLQTSFKSPIVASRMAPDRMLEPSFRSPLVAPQKKKDRMRSNER